MPALENPKWERFAQLVAEGKTADDAYASIGFKPNRFNASRLRTRENVTARIAELVAQGAARAELTLDKVIADIRSIAEADIRGRRTARGHR
jgi:phage terminase small subunit